MVQSVTPPTVDTSKRRRSRMSDFIRLNVRPEVQACLRSCEYVLALAATAQHQPFSKDELQLVTYYAAELDKMVGRFSEM